MILYDNIFIWYYMIIWLWLDNVMIMIIGYYRWYIYIYLYIWRRRRDDLIYLLLSGSWCSNRSPRGRDDCHPIANCENNNGCAWRVFSPQELAERGGRRCWSCRTCRSIWWSLKVSNLWSNRVSVQQYPVATSVADPVALPAPTICTLSQRVTDSLQVARE